MSSNNEFRKTFFAPAPTGDDTSDLSVRATWADEDWAVELVMVGGEDEPLWIPLATGDALALARYLIEAVEARG